MFVELVQLVDIIFEQGSKMEGLQLHFVRNLYIINSERILQRCSVEVHS